MSTLAEHAQNYLAIRRALGFKLVGEARLLAEFVAFAEKAGQRTITTQFALEWARRPASGSPNYLSRRLRAVRTFARYLHALDPACESRRSSCSQRATTAPPHTSTETRRSPR
jgi:integrase/recombinase XerD